MGYLTLGKQLASDRQLGYWLAIGKQLLEIKHYKIFSDQS